MDDLKANFIRLLVESKALLTGDFELKSGERSPYFIDFGRIPDGRHLDQMGGHYAAKIDSEIGLDAFDVVFGPAYKAIPIATATVIAMCRDYPREARALLVDDITSDGELLRNCALLSRAHGIGVDKAFVLIHRREGDADSDR
jgi:orotate phosphoribosyltransferase